MRCICLVLCEVALATAMSAVGLAQSPTTQEDLTKTITALDTALFDSYNRCQLDRFASYFTDDVEFYHDQGGLTVGSKALVESVKNNICGKVRRELVRGSLEIYPMRGIGAVEIGRHRFTHPGRDDREPVGEAKFIHLWTNSNGVWKVSRVISFDHKAAR